jgi:hypothetical protein
VGSNTAAALSLKTLARQPSAFDNLNIKGSGLPKEFLPSKPRHPCILLVIPTSHNMPKNLISKHQMTYLSQKKALKACSNMDRYAKTKKTQVF